MKLHFYLNYRTYGIPYRARKQAGLSFEPAPARLLTRAVWQVLISILSLRKS